MRVFLKVTTDVIQKSLYCGVFGLQGDYVPVNHALAVMLRGLLGENTVKTHYSYVMYFDKEGHILCRENNSEETKRFFAEFMNMSHDVEQRYCFLRRRLEIDIPQKVVDYYGEAYLRTLIEMSDVFSLPHENKRRIYL